MYIFLGLIFINAIAFSLNVLDPILMVRQSALALWVTGMIGFLSYKFKAESIELDGFVLTLLGFIFYAVVSLFWTTNFSLGLIAVTRYILFALYLLVFYFFIHRYKIDFFKSFVWVLNGVFLVSLIPFVINVLDVGSISRASLYNVVTLNGHKNLYASFLFLTAVLNALSLTFLDKLGKRVLYFFLFVQLLVIGVLQSRAVIFGGLVFAIIVGVVYALYRLNYLYRFKNGWFAIVVGIISFNLFFVFLFPNFIEFYLAETPQNGLDGTLLEASTLTERMHVWEKTYLVIYDNLFLGVGGGNWRIFYPSFSVPDIYKVTDLHSVFQRPHNDFLGVFSEFGWLGMNLFYGFFVGVIMTLYHKLTKNFSWSLLISMAGILGYLTISFFSFPGERIAHGLLLYTLMGVAIYFIRTNVNTSFFKLNLPVKYFWVLGVVSVVAFYFSFLSLQGEFYTKQYIVEKAKGNYENVIGLGKKAESIAYTLDPTSIPVGWYTGNAYVKMKNLKKAMVEFERAYVQHPYNHIVINDLASGYYVTGQIERAIEYYEKSAQINPRFDDPKLNLTAIYINQGNFKLADKWCSLLNHDSERSIQYEQIILDNK